MKQILLITLIAILIKYGYTQNTAQKYCNMKECKPNTSIACLYTQNNNMKCSGSLLQLNSNKIVQQHNKLRSKVATGSLPSYKSASFMAQMKWSNELAQMAEYNIKRCQFGHDQCRSTANFPKSGQNLYIYKQYGNRNFNPYDQISEGINSWFNEYKDANMNVINKYHDIGKMIGHFTVMVKDTNTHVGCAAARYQDGKWDTVLFACNYADNNIFDRPIYKSGRTASQCKRTSSSYKGLCV